MKITTKEYDQLNTVALTPMASAIVAIQTDWAVGVDVTTYLANLKRYAQLILENVPATLPASFQAAATHRAAVEAGADQADGNTASML